MRKARFLVLLLAGCDSVFQLYRPGDDAPLDAPLVDAALVDVGPDAQLGCWGSATFDEDGDGVSDGCDVCPLDSSDVDDDLDGVGNTCDADPNSKQRYVLFDAFGDAAIQQGWVVDSGAWLSNVTAQTFDHLDAAAARAHRPLNGARYPALETEVVMERLASTGTAGLTGVFGSMVEVSCLYQLTGADEGTLTLAQGTTPLAVSPAFQVPADGRVRIRMTVKPDGVRCKLLDATVVLAGIGPVVTSIDQTARQTALTAEGARVKFFWAMATATRP